MQAAYFMKVTPQTTISDLNENANYQMRHGHKAVRFNAIGEICLSASDFKQFSDRIYVPISDVDLCLKSVTSKDGKLNCIIVKCNTDNRNVVVYTGGRTIPLYAAVLLGK